MGIRRSRDAAWVAVRGKPSRMKEALRFSIRVVVVVVGGGAESHPLEESSEEMRSRMTLSGTRFPARMVDSALRPSYLCVRFEWLYIKQLKEGFFFFFYKRTNLEVSCCEHFPEEGPPS